MLRLHSVAKNWGFVEFVAVEGVAVILMYLVFINHGLISNWA